MSDVVKGPPRGALLWGNLAWHPAAQAWSGLRGEPVDPEAIEVLRGGRESATYRLSGAGPLGESVVAQRCTAARAAVERTIHERILPRVAVTTPRYHGARDAGDGSVWLFFEDVGSERSSKTDPEHLALAGQWIARLHVGAAAIPAARELPDAGPNRYREHLHAGHDTMRSHLGNRSLSAADVTLLERLLGALDQLDRSWSDIEGACAGLPATLTHGDFRAKNAYVRPGTQGLQVFPIDWETAGWGVPAVDLTKIDLTAYASVVRRAWPEASAATLRRLAAVGRIFLELAAICWVSPQLAYETTPYLERPLAWLRVYDERLAAAVHELCGPI